MGLISDVMLILGALGAGIYCMVLSRRLSRFTDLERGVGGAVAVLSAQVDDLTRTLKAAEAAAAGSARSLADLTSRAEQVAQRLELHVAAMHDLPGASGMATEDMPGPAGPGPHGPASEASPSPGATNAATNAAAAAPPPGETAAPAPATAHPAAANPATPHPAAAPVISFFASQRGG